MLPPTYICATFVVATVMTAVTEMFADPLVPVLNCNPQPVTRGADVTCEVSGAGFSRVSSWRFEGGGATVTGPSSGASWGGTMVQGGTVTATIQGYTTQLQQSITVNNRSWVSQVVNAEKVDNGTFASLPTPPYYGDGTLGQYLWQYSFQLPNTTQVPAGPNQGFHYFASQPTFNQPYRYEVNPDLENPQSDFAQHQYGACGVISRANLENNVVQHESSGQAGVRSHYNQYKAALTRQDQDPGIYAESRVARPQDNPQTFAENTRSDAASLLQTIHDSTASHTALCGGPNLDQTTCTSMGNVNWAPSYPYTCNP